MSRRIGITGGREFLDHRVMYHAFVDWTRDDDVIVHGDARGADRLAASTARHFMFHGEKRPRKTEAHPADWRRHGRAAGFIRNQEMVDSGLDLLLAFPGGRGTADMIRRATSAGVKVVECGASEK